MCGWISLMWRKLSSRCFSSKFLAPEITENISNGRYQTIGHSAQIKTSFQQKDLNLFAELSGDHNPIHLDPNYCKTKTKFHAPICHGILVSSLFSTLFGQLIPGSIYLKQNIQFLKPVYVNGFPLFAHFSLSLTLVFRHHYCESRHSRDSEETDWFHCQLFHDCLDSEPS
jgi:hypothetical protein